MLDQNTDRMWYVIGAVIIGGLILTSSIILFTDVAFAGVQDAFSMFSNVVGGNNKKDLNYDMSELDVWDGSDIKRVSDMAIEFSTSDRYRSGVKISSDNFEKGKRYKVTFDLSVLSGTVEGIGGHMLFSKDVNVKVNGVGQDYWWGNAGGSGESYDNLNDWAKGVIFPSNLNQVQHVELIFHRDFDDSEIIPPDKDLYIQPNRTNGTGVNLDNSWDKNKLHNRVLLENLKIYELSY